jgi:hypothetical protein
MGELESAPAAMSDTARLFRSRSHRWRSAVLSILGSRFHPFLLRQPPALGHGSDPTPAPDLPQTAVDVWLQVASRIRVNRWRSLDDLPLTIPQLAVPASAALQPRPVNRRARERGSGVVGVSSAWVVPRRLPEDHEKSQWYAIDDEVFDDKRVVEDDIEEIMRETGAAEEAERARQASRVARERWLFAFRGVRVLIKRVKWKRAGRTLKWSIKDELGEDTRAQTAALTPARPPSRVAERVTEAFFSTATFTASPFTLVASGIEQPTRSPLPVGSASRAARTKKAIEDHAGPGGLMDEAARVAAHHGFEPPPLQRARSSSIAFSDLSDKSWSLADVNAALAAERGAPAVTAPASLAAPERPVRVTAATLLRSVHVHSVFEPALEPQPFTALVPPRNLFERRPTAVADLRRRRVVKAASEAVRLNVRDSPRGSLLRREDLSEMYRATGLMSDRFQMASAIVDKNLWVGEIERE